MEKILKGKVAVVTGASNGIGEATARTLAGRGAAVVLAARRSLVTVEEVVTELDPRPGAVVLPSWVVPAVAPVPGGARPSYAQGYYDRDNGYYQRWDAVSRDRDRFRAWLEAEVYA
jgi:glutaconate CoA-transferase, subunit A